MGRPRFLADEDLRGGIIRAVRRMAPSLEIATIYEQQLSAATDEDVLQFAWQHKWLVLSHDVNTMKACAERRMVSGQGVHGLLLVPQRSSIRTIAESIVLVWQASEFEEWQNRVVYLPL